ncbi:putative NADH dehydrogenase-like complex, subunit S [Medicago truncatula]|uniref:Plant/T32A16-60 protein n=1 Tax=Medicago truncatula TaxID=3880 RepID=G7LCN2_MEDTR|nr:NAD(P)H-quinone oxidoreductase subunit S, chloroplastic [Medicago truncatula]AET02099.1 plant/T32A16-60 protein [Medicago truncatula]AFK45026.1 unknown [Medicago truncatula]RHN39999.1 putative NADH dehydrogenase-like complex, subunit S [Medicago truncatula]
MSSFVALHSLHGSLLRSKFLGQENLTHLYPHSNKASIFHSKPTFKTVQTCAKFDLLQIMGGRGLCKGEEGLQKELKREVGLDDQNQPTSSEASDKEQEDSTSNSTKSFESVAEDGFDKELMGLTGGFPGGEKGLKKFIEENPLPKTVKGNKSLKLSSSEKPKPPELPMLLPGMIAIVKNQNNPFYMYCGIVQRITDGKAGVLFEGGNWDKLITFRLEELERREKGPPMKNPKSCVLEPFLVKKS